jgi:hypothetical protein
MLTIYGRGQGPFCDSISRRSFLKIGGLAFGGLALPQILAAEAQAGIRDSHKAVIMIVLPGGPPHLDMYDLKPDAPAEVRGEFKPIHTKVPGIAISELMPRLAQTMDKVTLVRSLVGALDDHNVHQCITGWESHPQQDDSPNTPGYPQGGWPSFGSVISKVKGPADPSLPPFVSLQTPRALSMCRASLGQPGFLGLAHAGFEAHNMDRGDIVLKGVRLEQMSDRKALLTSFDSFRREVDASGAADGMDAIHRQALSLITSSKLAEALNLDREDPHLRRRYGIPDGSVAVKGGPKLLENFLLARRLVEAGVRVVSLAFSMYPLERESRGGYNWDWHAGNFEKARKCVPMLDQGVAALVEDLEARGLSKDVSVVAWGEFGRSPRINGAAGRDHWPPVNTCVLAGGGMHVGQVIGATSRLGEHVTQRPVHYREVFATLYHNLGIDGRRLELKDPINRPQFLVGDYDPIRELL